MKKWLLGLLTAMMAVSLVYHQRMLHQEGRPEVNDFR